MAETTDQYIVEVFSVLQSNPTAQHIDYLVEAFTRVGYLAAQAEGAAEYAEAERKFHWATAYSAIKQSGEKTTDTQATAMADIQTWDYKKAEVKAYEKAKKLKNLLDSIEQAINAIKFLGKNDGLVTASFPKSR